MDIAPALSTLTALTDFAAQRPKAKLLTGMRAGLPRGRA